MSKLRKYTIGDFIESVSITHTFPKERIIFLNTSDIFDGRILHSNYSEIAGLPGQAKKSIKKGDILFSEIRPANKRYALVGVDADDYVVSTKLMVLRKKSDVVDFLFFYKWLTSETVLARFQDIAESRSGTFPQITFDVIKDIEIDGPSEKESQTGVASILSSLDDKIELNRCTNQTLEQIAQILFKKYFVDDIDLGNLPEGWSIKTIEDVSLKVGMGPFGANIKVETFSPSGMPIISGQNLNSTILEDKQYNFISFEHAERLKNSIVYRGDVIFTHAGNIGQVSAIPHTSKYEKYILSQRQFYLRPNPEIISEYYLTLYFKSGDGQFRLLSHASSTGVPSISQPVTNLRRMQILVPEKKIMSEFHKIIDSLYGLVGHNNLEIENLLEFRDSLLPRLMSGEIKVNAAEKRLTN
jgi:type I restriction enzyme S subunit